MSELTDIPLAVVGCDFRVASSCWRSRLVLTEEQAREIALGLKRNGAADGFADLNTCNRNEWFVSSRNPGWAAELLRSHLLSLAGPGANGWLKPYVHLGEEAARHVFRVALGQESLVVGERQIASQLNQALERARARGFSSRILNGLGMVSGRLVRIGLRRGCIESAAVGVHSLALSLLRSRFKGDRQVPVAVVGLGQIGRRVLGLLEEDRRFQPVGCNRTVAETGPGRVRPLDELASVLDGVEAAVVCSGAPHPVISRKILATRSNDRPLLVVDIGIPRQVESAPPADGLEIIGLDELRVFHQACHPEGESRAAAREIDGLVERAVEEFRSFCNQQAFSGILDTVHKHHRLLVSEEIPRLITERFGYLPDRARDQLQLDLKGIVLDYTSEVFRTIKEVSRREGEAEECRNEN